MEDKNLTAVEWLVDKFSTQGTLHSSDISQAKEMEKKQHSKTWDESMRNLDVRGGNIVRAWDDFDEHYEKMINK